MLARVGYSGERGYEIYASAEDAPRIRRNILEAGKDHGIQLCVFVILTPVRVEAGLFFHPFDVTSAYSHRMKRSLAFAHLDPDVTKGATLTVGKNAGAQDVAVEDLPFYDKKKERPHA